MDRDTIIILYVLAGMLYVLLAWLAIFLIDETMRVEAVSFPGLFFMMSICVVVLWPFVLIVDAITYSRYKRRKDKNG